jgi:5-methylthioribose kinase
MTVSSGQILTSESIPQYLEERLGDLTGVVDTVEGLEVKAIIGGNVNYAFCLTLKNGRTLFLKQAPEFVAIFGPDGFPLTSERMQREMDVYEEWKTILSTNKTEEDGDDLAKAYLPEIYYFDSKYLHLLLYY